MKKQIKSNRWLAALLMLGAVMFTGCVDKDNPIVETQNVVAFADDALTDGVLLVDPYAGKVTFDIKAAGEWRIEEDVRFFYLSPSSGTGPATVTLTVQDNTSDDRKDGQFTVVFPGHEAQNQTITVEQKWMGEMPVNATEISTSNQVYAVGYSYDATGEYASPSSVKVQIFDTDKMIQKKVLSLGPTKLDKTESIVTGSSIAEISNNLAVKAEVSGGFGKFQAEASGAFNMANQTNTNYEYAISYIDMAVHEANIQAEDFATLKDDYMTDDAWNNINGVTVEKRGVKKVRYPSTREGFKALIDSYGTHVIMRARLGGRVRCAIAVDISKVTSSYDIAAFAKASYGNVFVNGSLSVDEKYKESYEDNLTSITRTLSVLGGDENMAKSIAMGTGYNQQNCEAWVNSVTEDNMALVGFPSSSDKDKYGALVPLYELVEKNATLENGGFDGKARYEALKAYMEGDAIAQDFSTYDCGTVTSFKVPTFSSDDESLIKDITIDGQWVGQVCNEFIPNITREARVTVVYPVINNQPRYNMGFFLGNRSHKPARVSWNGTNVAIEEYTNLDLGAVETLYLRGASISPTVYDGTVAIEGEVKDEYLTALNYETPTKDYALVKIFDHIWMREDYAGVKTYSGVSLDSYRDHYPDYHYWRDTKKVFYDNGITIYQQDQGIHTPGFAPPGWELPSWAHFNSIRDKLVSNGINMVGNAFIGDGVLGLNATDGWRLAYWTSSSEFQPVYYPNKGCYYHTSDIFEYEGDPCGGTVKITNSDITLNNKTDHGYYYLVRFVKK